MRCFAENYKKTTPRLYASPLKKTPKTSRSRGKNNKRNGGSWTWQWAANANTCLVFSDQVKKILTFQVANALTSKATIPTTHYLNHTPTSTITRKPNVNLLIPKQSIMFGGVVSITGNGQNLMDVVCAIMSWRPPSIYWRGDWEIRLVILGMTRCNSLDDRTR